MEEVELDLTLQPSKDVVFESLMRNYGQQVIRLVYLLVRDRALSEDITQEVFLKAYKGLDSFRGESNLKTWIYRIAVNESKSYLRSWSFRNIFSTWLKDKEKKLEALPTAGVEPLVMHRLKTEEMIRRLTAMSPQYRQVIVLHYYEELSNREIADILNISEEAVRQKLHRARKQLKRILEEEGEQWM